MLVSGKSGRVVVYASFGLALVMSGLVLVVSGGFKLVLEDLMCLCRRFSSRSWQRR